MYKFRSMVIDAEARKAALMAKNEGKGGLFKLTERPPHHPARASSCGTSRWTSCRSSSTC